ncbi:Glutamate--tRNA ligase [Candidatus Izimaplasma bacterium HR1]|jgi:glutamyl-tRNA synthetase|uniref:glutamate--tRNA ligase n=1 Tax=Candidatus Izimoplasma sp. HR1 TaxID=1541959 RepID=UPI0004F92F4B|nr:Glutamate--tRNA ligase [Candidatus Izimaplasma bacterium HR1]
MAVRTRFAPSPTGFIHVGNLRSAIFTYLIAKKDKGTFVLRIEDTDQERYVEGAVDTIYYTLDSCGLLWDEGPDKGGEFGPYIQSERMEQYKKYALQLVEKKEAYKCFCTPERLVSLREDGHAKYDKHCLHLTEEEVAQKETEGIPYVIRQKVPETGSTSFTCQVYGEIKIDNKEIEDQIILKSDNYPTYNFANVIDDHLMNITHVVRGNEYLTSTPKYTLLYKALGWDEPTYVHLPHVIKEGGKKLSKREGDAYYTDFIKRGYLPDAIVNFLVLLGWSPENNQEKFSLTELEEIFSIDRINKSPAVFDIKKLNWVNAQYIKELSIDELKEVCMPHLVNSGIIEGKDESWIDSLLNVFKDRISYGEEVIELYDEFFNLEFKLDEEATEFLNQEGVNDTLIAFKELLIELENFTAQDIKPLIKQTGKISGSKGKMLYMPLRIATTASMHGPDLPQVLALLGKDTVIERLNSNIK